LTTAPSLKGIHHLKLPVRDLTTSIDWYQRVFGAEHIKRFDHYDRAGTRYAVILRIPGIDVPVELRWAPTAAESTRGYDPVSFTAGSEESLARWRDHLDALDIEHSPIITALAGKLLIFVDPDGTYLRVLTMPGGGLDAISISDVADEPAGPWLVPDLMRHPTK
jgi:catechol 2,3-dioxygenase-like lactoylglutathione lyase family enzyme